MTTYSMDQSYGESEGSLVQSGNIADMIDVEQLRKSLPHGELELVLETHGSQEESIRSMSKLLDQIRPSHLSYKKDSSESRF